MTDQASLFWAKRLATVKETLEGNNFRAFVVDSPEEARTLVLDLILPESGARRISWGGSATFRATGLYDDLTGHATFEVLDPYKPGLTGEEAYDIRRQALLSDLYFSGANAITETGALVNLDMYGNRAGAITFGPKKVVVIAGRNKIAPDLDDAFLRIKTIAAPANAMRLGKKTPCAITAVCDDCTSPDRICNTWAITEKSFPAGRITVILINRDLGL